MKRMISVFLCVALLFGLCACAGKQAPTVTTTEAVKPTFAAAEPLVKLSYPQKAAEKAPSKDFLSAVQGFSFKTAAKIFNGKAQNNNFSPLSLYYALAVTSSGAAGNTQKQLLSLLGVKSSSELSSQCKFLFNTMYSDTDACRMLTANSLWLNKNSTFKNDFLQNAAKYFYAESFSSDFSDAALGKKVGGWIAGKTNNTLSPDFKFDEQDQLLLVNTVYLKARWNDPFRKSADTKGTFHGAKGNTDAVFMNNSDLSTAFFGNNFTRASLPLEGSFRMTFVLPKEGTELSSLFSSEKALRAAMTGGTEKSASITWKVPKFKIDSKYDDLTIPMKALGITDAFNEKADFSAIADQPLMISMIEQGTHLAVDENGVEASAFTAEMLSGASMPQAKAEMILDRPFLFAIVLNSNPEVPLFIGVCADL